MIGSRSACAAITPSTSRHDSFLVTALRRGTGNSFILKPSERVPITSAKLFELIGKAASRPVVLQLVHAATRRSTPWLDHPVFAPSDSRLHRHSALYYSALRPTESEPNAREARNPVVIMPDADME